MWETIYRVEKECFGKATKSFDEEFNDLESARKYARANCHDDIYYIYEVERKYVGRDDDRCEVYYDEQSQIIEEWGNNDADPKVPTTQYVFENSNGVF